MSHLVQQHLTYFAWLNLLRVDLNKLLVPKGLGSLTAQHCELNAIAGCAKLAIVMAMVEFAK
jgi:hypothetical protein